MDMVKMALFGATHTLPEKTTFETLKSTSGYATWFMAGGAIRIALRQL